mmetsp:Transcript_10208/g.13312  ORF Transcript_10208/g.13312 Transcript_10208/m.13312 type:complete len:449 (-) Transcript_10208:539-1885(-)
MPDFSKDDQISRDEGKEMGQDQKPDAPIIDATSTKKTVDANGGSSSVGGEKRSSSLDASDNRHQKKKKIDRNQIEPKPKGGHAKPMTAKQRRKIERRTEMSKAGVHFVRRPGGRRKKKQGKQEWFTEELIKQQEYMFKLQEKHHQRPQVPQYKEETINAEKCYRKMLQELKGKWKREKGLMKNCPSLEQEGSCKFGTRCIFAHPGEDLKTRVFDYTTPTYTIKVDCQQWQGRGFCAFRDKCLFVHEGEVKSDSERAKKKAPRVNKRRRSPPAGRTAAYLSQQEMHFQKPFNNQQNFGGNANSQQPYNEPEVFMGKTDYQQKRLLENTNTQQPYMEQHGFVENINSHQRYNNSTELLQNTNYQQSYNQQQSFMGNMNPQQAYRPLEQYIEAQHQSTMMGNAFHQQMMSSGYQELQEQQQRKQQQLQQQYSTVAAAVRQHFYQGQSKKQR